MAYLLDTCVISETVAKRPNPQVADWFKHQDDNGLYISVITWGEIRRGIFQLPSGKRRLKLEQWLADVLEVSFAGRIVGIDQELMTTWARIIARYRSRKITRPVLDSLIEATAFRNGLILVTRNEKDFADSEVSILNPWEAND